MGHSRAIWGHLGSHLGHFGSFLAIFGPFCGMFEEICGKFKFFCGIINPAILAFRMYGIRGCAAGELEGQVVELLV